MTNVINISDFTPHWSGEVKCYNCGNEWIGVAPVGVLHCECPQCHSTKGIPMHPHLPQDGDDVYECNCGCWHFSVTRKGVFCMNCGTTTSFEALV